jgi:N-acetylglutamate synthase-like GNAT family acetyltransferase
MNSPGHQGRRATLDDLQALIALWQVAGLPALELEKHFTDFQVVARTDGPLIGAIGLSVQGHHGKLHSEAFFHPEQEEEFRPQIWQRVQMVARNHGLTRLWTHEASAFWQRCGFEEADAETLKKLPASFVDLHPGWRTLQLRDEAAISHSLDQEFELFRVTEKENTEKLIRKAKTLRMIATVIAVILFGVVLAGLVQLVRQNRLGGRR